LERNYYYEMQGKIIDDIFDKLPTRSDYINNYEKG
jgi:hypothetical protein